MDIWVLIMNQASIVYSIASDAAQQKAKDLGIVYLGHARKVNVIVGFTEITKKIIEIGAMASSENGEAKIHGVYTCPSNNTV